MCEVWKRAEDGARTRHLKLGRLPLYQMSYFREVGVSVKWSGSGERRIRTSEGFANRFTVCPIWPLWYLPELSVGVGCDKYFQRTFLRIPGFPFFLSRWTGSNRRQADYKSAALPAELHRHLFASNRCTHKFFPLFTSMDFPPGRKNIGIFRTKRNF